LKNFARRLENNMNIYLGRKKAKNDIYGIIYVYYFTTLITPIQIYASLYEDSAPYFDKFKKMINYLEKIDNRYNYSFKLTIEQAEKFIFDMKNNFIQEDIEKYNL
jgi:hypothetical protein